MVSADVHLTQLLQAWQRRESGADEELFTVAYEELRRQAARFMRQERPNHTLQPTAVVNEAWLQIQATSNVQFRNSSDFFGFAATIMRHVLTDYARRKNAEKRGGGKLHVTLSDDIVADAKQQDLDVLALDEALCEFENIDPVRCRVVELRYFGGLSIEITAKVLGRGVRSVNRDWFVAKAWLFDRLTKS